MSELLRETINARWKEAIEDLFIVNHLEWDDNDPRGSLNRLIGFEVSMALDPAISQEAQKLYKRGWNDGVQNFLEGSAKSRQSFDNYAAGYRS